jgi:hypothetical protein
MLLSIDGKTRRFSALGATMRAVVGLSFAKELAEYLSGS